MVSIYDDDTWRIVTRTHMASYSLINIVRLLWINKFRVSFRYIPRILWSLWVSLITLPLRIIENIRFNKRIKQTQITKDPIFIIGCYRTGTTLLHILLSKDDQFGYVSNLDVFSALFNLSFSKTARRVLERALPETRPMDNIELIIDEPQEESYAVATSCKYGVPNALLFPRNFDYFTKFASFEQCPPKELKRWKKIYHYFLQKTTLKHEGKQLVLKNPLNATRIKYLLDMYPNAKFIYTYRNPYTLYCSNKIMVRKTIEIATMQTWDNEEVFAKFVKLIAESFAHFEKTQALIPPENFYMLKYEEFIKDPVHYIGEIYNKFGLRGFKEVKPILQKYLEAKRNYKSNTHMITPEIVDIVDIHWNDYRIKHGYEKIITSKPVGTFPQKPVKQES